MGMRYNQLQLSNGVVLEATDQTVYFEPVESGKAVALSYSDFEAVYSLYMASGEYMELSSEISVEISERFVHFITYSFTVSIKISSLEHAHEYYQQIKAELRDLDRKVIFVRDQAGEVLDTHFASADAVAETVALVQSLHSGANEIEVDSVEVVQSS